MSRSHKSKDKNGKEFWGRRCRNANGMLTRKYSKFITHKFERSQSKQIINEQASEEVRHTCKEGDPYCEACLLGYVRE